MDWFLYYRRFCHERVNVNFSQKWVKGVQNVFINVIYVMKPGTLLKLTFLHGCFSRFLNCTNGTKSRNVSHIRRILQSKQPGYYEK